MLELDSAASLEVAAALHAADEDAYELQSVTFHGRTLSGFGTITSQTNVRRIVEVCKLSTSA